MLDKEVEKQNRLIAFGCSMTAGDELQNPATQAWPVKLAELYGRSVVNYGRSGVSNKYICYKILNTNFQPDDIVFVNWTYFTRSCVIEEPYTDTEEYWKSSVTNLGRFRWHGGFSKVERWLKYFHSLENEFFDSCIYINLAYKFLQQKSIKAYHMVLATYWDDKILSYIPYNKVNFLDNLYFDDYIDKFPTKGRNLVHPNSKGHDRFAKDIFNQLGKNV